MPGWQDALERLRAGAARLPKLFWAAAAVIVASLGVVAWLEMAGPPYAVLNEGLSPADGGKVIAQLQKLGIPYQLQAEGNVILVPELQLAQARLQLGQDQVPQSDAATAWAQVENAPMTASDLAQSTMAQQALELTLQQTIEGMNGIKSAQVFLALPPATPFLADAPKPSGSVIIDTDTTTAQTQGEAIAKLVAGAVPGLDAANVTVATTAGVNVYPADSAITTGTQLATQAQVEAQAAARISGLLIPLVGTGNFQTGVSAALDFTQEHVHQISYGPSHLLAHDIETQSQSYGQSTAAIGIPGALSNEPPAQTTASTAAPPSTGGGTSGNAPSTTTPVPAAAPQKPTQSTSNADQTYVTDESDADITDPDWTVKSLAVSVLLNKDALAKGVTTDQVKAALAGAFAYPQVSVNVLAVDFTKAPPPLSATPLVQAAGPLAHAGLALLAALALLFGLALPLGKRISAVNVSAFLPPPPRAPLPVMLPVREFPELREQAAENVPGVARLLQSWAEDNE